MTARKQRAHNLSGRQDEVGIADNSPENPVVRGVCFMMGQQQPFDGDDLVSDREGEDDEAREISERLPLHDPDYGYRILMRAAFMYRQRRWSAGLVISPAQDQPEFNLGDADVQ